jgi:predicted ATP-dependent endonuclease of OLD family
MKISKITIHNFRSLREVSFAPGQFNVLIGQNNHGKSNLFEAIEWFYSGKGNIGEIRHCDARPDEDVIVEIEFSGLTTSLENISSETNRKKIANIVGQFDTMLVKRSSASQKDRLIFHPDKKKWQKQPAGADSAFNNCIPRFEFVEATKNLKDVTAFKTTTPIGQMLSGVVSEVLEKDEAYQDFREQFEKLFQSEDSKVRTTLNELSSKVRDHLAQQFPDCASISFDVRQPEFEEFLKNYNTQLDDGVKTRAEDKGDGMQRALMLAIIKTHADFRREEALGRAFIFFIDEAELHLHPTGQRQLKQALLELSAGVDQVFITTHSSVFIADEHTSQKIFKVEKESKCTTVTPVGKREKQSIVYDLLGGNPADLLLPANFMITEGKSEEIFINGVIRRFYSDRPAIHIIPATGDDDQQRQSMNGLNKIFDPLKARPIYREKLTLLFDKPDEVKQPRFDDFKRENRFLGRNGQIHVLPVNGLEDYYPQELTNNCRFEKKTKKAKWMADRITREQFEQEMEVIHQALQHCWDNAYEND